jgi:hypothetical protein
VPPAREERPVFSSIFFDKAGSLCIEVHDAFPDFTFRSTLTGGRSTISARRL